MAELHGRSDNADVIHLKQTSAYTRKHDYLDSNLADCFVLAILSDVWRGKQHSANFDGEPIRRRRIQLFSRDSYNAACVLCGRYGDRLFRFTVGQVERFGFVYFDVHVGRG